MQVGILSYLYKDIEHSNSPKIAYVAFIISTQTDYIKYMFEKT